MYRVGATGPGCIDDPIDAKVTLTRRTRTDRYCLIRHADVPGCAITFGIHRHRREAHVTTRADDAHRDLPAVGDEDLAQNHAILAFGVMWLWFVGRYLKAGADTAQHRMHGLRRREFLDERRMPTLRGTAGSG